MSKARSEYLVPLVAALLGLTGGLLGAYLGARATVTTQRENAREDRRGEARAKRAEVYSDFLENSESFASASRDLDLVRFKSRLLSNLGRAAARAARAECRRPGVCDALYNDVAAARSEFLAALTQVYIYGTPRAVGAARTVTAGLPPSRIQHRGLNALVGRSSKPDAVDEDVYSRGYDAFLDTMCAEVSADPRPTC